MKIFDIRVLRNSICICISRSRRTHSYSLSRSSTKDAPFLNKSLHCYKTLYPWENFEEFSQYLISNIFYNEGMCASMSFSYASCLPAF